MQSRGAEKSSLVSLWGVAFALILSGCELQATMKVRASPGPQPVSTATPVPMPQAGASPSPSAVPSATPTPLPSSSPAPTASPSPSPIASPSPSPSPVATPAPGQLFSGSCPGFAQTKVINAHFPAAGGSLRYFTNHTTYMAEPNAAQSGFGAQDALILQFTAPSADNLFSLSMTETGEGVNGQESFHTITLSTRPCDFSVPAGPEGLFALENAAFSLSMSSGGVSARSVRVNLNPGQIYYVNVSNFAFGGQQSCPADYCNVFFTLANPN